MCFSKRKPFQFSLVLISFYRPSSVFRYTIRYKEAGSDGGVMQEITKQQTRVLRNLKIYTKYIIYVYAENKRGMTSAIAKTEATTMGGGIISCVIVIIIF